ncbi:putative lipoprotein [Leptospira santarosai str. 2000030832]|nr:putative lipoprotein [Leptospira santarosai str. 2000030832]
MLKIAVFAMTALFSIVSCKKDNNDDKNLLLALGLAALNEKAEFKLSNTSSLASARMGNSQTYRSHFSSGKLLDLAGNDPQNYGDGAADGFTDHFITPAAAGIEICQIVAYKSVAKGGPPVGSETFENANWYLRFGGGEFGPCSSIWPVGLKGEASGFVDLHRPIPNEIIKDFDRIGIVAYSFLYYLSPEQTPDSAYRYTALFLNNMVRDNIPVGGINRGDVGAKIFSNGCPTSYLSTHNYIYFKPTDMISNPNCRINEVVMDSSNGLSLRSDFMTTETYQNPPIPSGSEYSTDITLKYKLPTAAAGLGAKDPYVLVVPFDSSKAGGGKLLFEVSVDNVVFWDSNDGNNIFSPQSNAADRPNATSGADNLANTARKNMIFHLPTIVGSLK